MPDDERRREPQGGVYGAPRLRDLFADLERVSNGTPTPPGAFQLVLCSAPAGGAPEGGERPPPSSALTPERQEGPGVPGTPVTRAAGGHSEGEAWERARAVTGRLVTRLITLQLLPAQNYTHPLAKERMVFFLSETYF